MTIPVGDRSLLKYSWVAALPVAAYFTYQLVSRSKSNKNKKKKRSFDCNPHLKKHSEIFERKVIKIEGTGNANVYVAIGYSLANSILIEGTDGIIIIDTTESTTSASQVLEAFRQYTDKPVKGIIYTHFHHDHVGGTQAFIKDAEDVEIWAHETTGERIAQFTSIMAPVAYVRAAKMFGTKLDSPARENCGIGPFLAVDEKGLQQPFLPTHTYRGAKQRITLAGIDLDLIHAPGETDDQTVVYMPCASILFAADNYYESFPNLYTLRGAPNRDVLQWARSIDRMLQTHPHILVPSHTLPVYGSAEIQTRLTNYRDAIQYVHDQTVRQMLLHRHPEDISQSIELPASLRDCDYLKEFYGTTGWSAKAIFQSYLGWFSGDECELSPLTPAERSHRLLDLVGGSSHILMVKAQDAYDHGDYQWALELTSAILRVGGSASTSYSNDPLGNSSNSNEVYTQRRNSSGRMLAKARALKSKTCIRLGEQHISANARNWYMTCAGITCGDIAPLKLPWPAQRDNLLKMPLQSIFQALAVRFRPHECWQESDVSKSMCFVLTSNNQQEDEEERGWTLVIRNCVLYPKNQVMRDADIVIETTEDTLRQLFVTPASTIGASLLGMKTISVKKGDIATFFQFWNSIEKL